MLSCRVKGVILVSSKHYEQRKESNKRYLKKFDEIRIRVPSGTKDEYKSRADNVGKSLNQYIIDCIEKGQG